MRNTHTVSVSRCRQNGGRRIGSRLLLRSTIALSDTDILQKRSETVREAFAPSRQTVAKHSAALQSPSYRRDLDVVVVDENGNTVAFALIWFAAINQAGIFEPVGCQTRHQRRGLGRALVLEGIGRHRSFGERLAEVRSEPVGPSPAASTLYDPVGLVATDRLRLWRRLIAQM